MAYVRRKSVRVHRRSVGNISVYEVFCFTRSQSSFARMCAYDFIIGVPETAIGNESSQKNVHFNIMVDFAVPMSAVFVSISHDKVDV